MEETANKTRLCTENEHLQSMHVCVMGAALCASVYIHTCMHWEKGTTVKEYDGVCGAEKTSRASAQRPYLHQSLSQLYC